MDLFAPSAAEIAAWRQAYLDTLRFQPISPRYGPYDRVHNAHGPWCRRVAAVAPFPFPAPYCDADGQQWATPLPDPAAGPSGLRVCVEESDGRIHRRPLDSIECLNETAGGQGEAPEGMYFVALLLPESPGDTP